VPAEYTAVSPKLSALYKLNDQWGVFGTLARTERMPTLDELYSNDAGRQVSPGLDLETANSVELGLTYQREGLWSEGDSLRVKATAFHSDIKNLIVVNSAAGPVPRFDNVRAAEIWGAEVEAAYDSDRWFASLGYSNVRSAFRETGRSGNAGEGLTLPDTPAENVSLTLGLKVPDRGLTLGWTASYHDAITNANVPTAPTTPVSSTRTPSYHTHDLFVTWKPDSGALAGLDLTLTVENIFDADYKNNLSLDRGQGMNAKLSIARAITW
jgi:hemoglobin/transferrin/lactoferrin receptor protein